MRYDLDDVCIYHLCCVHHYSNRETGTAMHVLTVFGNQNEVLSRQMIKCSNSGGACHVNPRIRNTKQSSHVAGSQL